MEEAQMGQVERIAMPHNEIWIDAQNNLPPDNEKVIVCTDEKLLFCAVCQRLSRHLGENAPKDDKIPDYDIGKIIYGRKWVIGKDGVTKIAE